MMKGHIPLYPRNPSSSSSLLEHLHSTETETDDLAATYNSGDEKVIHEEITSCSYMEQSFFNGPKLVLFLAGLRGSKKITWARLVVLWVMCAFQVAYAIERTIGGKDAEFVYQRIGNSMWVFHSSLIFSIIAR